MNFTVKDFDLTFEAKGLRPLFQGISLEEYMPNESILFAMGNVGSSYISRNMLEQMKEKGREISSQKDFALVHKLKDVIAFAYAKGAAIKNLSKFSEEEAKACFQVLKDLSAVYGYFDNGYLDGAYEAAKSSSHATINVKEIEKSKNICREDINKIFFEEHGFWDILLGKLASQFTIDRNELEWYIESEVYALFQNHRCPQERIDARKLSFVFYKDETCKVIFLEGEESLEFIKNFNSTDRKSAAVSIIKGKTAHRTGKVITGRIYNISADYSSLAGLSEEMNTMAQDDILVSQTTAPELMPALQKASAIITDIGGMLSHAAIVSRELNIPCIVATGNASKILKNGDMVEVDAEQGIVRILNKK